jgi:hypothetical protein
MTEDEFMQKVLEAFPEAIVDQEYNSGELLIATGLKLEGGKTVPVYPMLWSDTA